MTTPSSSPNTVLITGATSGIGRHTAIDLAKRGYRVFASGRNLAALAELEASAHSNLTTIHLDVTDSGSIERAHQHIALATDSYGVDILINNAGYGDLGPIELATDDDLRRQFDTNVFGLMAVTRAFLPSMRARGSGRIINVSSVGGRITMPMFGIYSSSKYAVEALSDSLRMEMAAFGIQVILIEPGPIRTNFSQSAIARASKHSNEDGPYATVIDRSEKMASFAERASVGPEVISRAIRKAMTSRWPRARYVAPFRGRLMIALTTIMPTRLSDYILRMAAGFTRKNLTTANLAVPTTVVASSPKSQPRRASTGG